MIWDRLFAEGEVDRAFDYHRWRVIRNLVEVQGGLEMEDRHFYTGFVNEAGTLIKGLAAKWKMADWLIEKLEEIVELGISKKSKKLQIMRVHQYLYSKNYKVTKMRSLLLHSWREEEELCWNKMSIKT